MEQLPVRTLLCLNPQTCTIDRDFGKVRRNIRRVFDRGAKDLEIDLRWTKRPWPTEKNQKKGMMRSEADVTDHDLFGHLYTADTYHAGLAVGVVEQLDDIGPELAHLLLSKRIACIYIVSLNHIPVEDRRSKLRGLNAVALRNRTDADSGFFLPDDSDALEYNTPLERGALHIAEYEQLRPDNVHQAILLSAFSATQHPDPPPT